MELKRNGSQPSAKGTAENFTGNVRVDPLFQSPGPAQFSGALVTFEPGARSAWYAPMWSNVDRDFGSWLDAMRRRSEGRHTSRRCHHMPYR